MVSRNLVICDQEERYAAALAHFFMKTKELALGVQVCNSVAQALRLQEESPIDILLIGSGYPQEERQKVRAESVFVLTQSEDVAHETHEKLINKRKRAGFLSVRGMCISEKTKRRRKHKKGR